LCDTTENNEHHSATDKTVSCGVEMVPTNSSIDAGTLTPSDQVNHPNEQSQPSTDKTVSQINENNRAQMVINRRKDLGRLTRWSGPAADKATSVAKAIEIVLKNTVFI
jgi:hypothetical protein